MRKPIDKQIDKLEKLMGAAKTRHKLEDRERRRLVLLRSLEALLENRDIPTWLKSGDGTMLYINPAYEQAFNVQKKECEGRATHEIWSSDLAEQFSAHDDEVIASKETRHLKLPYHEMILHLRKWPVYIDGVFIGVAGEAYCEAD